MIGFFDSGSGGLSVLKAVRAACPQADICYFGDIANAPYGIKSSEELCELARAGIAKLKAMGATQIVAACNSVSPAMLQGAAGDTPVIEMSRPFAHAMEKRRKERMLLLATPATIGSGLYERATGDMIDIDPLPIPELAGAIEFGAPQQEIERIVRESLETKRGHTFSAIILGCTHYPLVRDVIEKIAQDIFGAAELIDPAQFVAEEVAKHFDTGGTGMMSFFISKDSEPFRQRVAALQTATVCDIVAA